MRLRLILTLLMCVGAARSVPPSVSASSSATQQNDASNVLMKRDDQYGHSAPASSSYASYSTDGGHYYYYHPVEEVAEEMGNSKKKEYCPIDTVLAPLIVITIFAGVIAGNSVGLVPKVQFALPQATMDAINALKPDPFGIKPDIIGPANAWIPAIPTGRRAMPDDSSYDVVNNATQIAFDQLSAFVMDVIEADDCASRLICETGKYAEGQRRILGMVHFLTPSIYRNKMSIFKDAALKKSDCRKYKCGFMEGNEI